MRVPGHSVGSRARRRIGARATRRAFIALATVLLWLVVPSARADPSHQPVCYEGPVGPYTARILVRPPGVIPGLAEISIRPLRGDVREITALPIKWNTGRKGAPPPDEALPVRGEPGLYSAQLWFMEGGAHSIEVTLRGPAGEGRVLLPVNSIATRVLSMPVGLSALLAFLGASLFLLFVGIVGAAAREAVLEPGEIPSARRRWGSRFAAALAAVLAMFLTWGGWNWWKAEAAHYMNNRLFRPVPTEARLVDTPGGKALQLTLEGSRAGNLPPLVPDHGRLMHLFLVREPDMDAFAHLHPIRVHSRLFESALPRLPGGEYSLYAQVTHETGFSQTFTNRVRLPPWLGEPVLRLDAEDAWWPVSDVAPDLFPAADANRASLGGGWFMIFEPIDPPIAREFVSLRFSVRDEAGRGASLDPYLGMLGHLVARSADRRVFAHVHPGGSYSMAAQEVFKLRADGRTPLPDAFDPADPTCRPSEIRDGDPGSNDSAGLRSGSSELAFPYAFPEPGRYRLWVQVRVDGRIRTGTFDLEVIERPGR